MNAFKNMKYRQILSLTILSIFVFQYTEAQVKVDTLYSISKVEDKYPRFSPDGEYIVFESNRPGINSQIFSMKSDGTAITQLTNNQLAQQRQADQNQHPLAGTSKRNFVHRVLLIHDALLKRSVHGGTRPPTSL